MSRPANKRTPKVAIGCGGTGGHFYPGLTVAEALLASEQDVVLLIGGHHQAAQLKHCADKGINAHPLTAPKLPRGLAAVPMFGLRFLQAVWYCLGMLRREGVDVVLTMGSFASAPLAVAAKLSGRRLVIHDGNALMGKANRMLRRIANVSAIAFPPHPATPNASTIAVVGMPVRKAIVEAAETPPADSERPNILQQLGLEADRPTLLLFGGSQGATVLNSSMSDAISHVQERLDAFQIIHLTGQADNQALINAYESAGLRTFVAERTEEMAQLLWLSDLVICRAGGSTIAELTIIGRTAIFVPLASAADDHQTANIQHLLEADAATTIAQSEVNGSRLAEAIGQWLDAPEAVATRATKMRTLAKVNATQELIELLNG